MPKPVPTMLTTKAVMVPAKAPNHQPIAPPIVAPREIASFFTLARLRHECIPGLSHFPPIGPRTHQTRGARFRAFAASPSSPLDISKVTCPCRNTRICSVEAPGRCGPSGSKRGLCRSGPGAAPRPAHQETARGQQTGRQPDPSQLAGENAEASGVEDTPDTDRGDFDGPEREEVPRVAEWGEEGDARSAVGQRVEQSMRRQHEGEVETQPPTIRTGAGRTRIRPRRGEAGGDGEEQGVGEPSMPGDGPGGDAEPEPDGVEVRDDRQGAAGDQGPRRNPGPVEAGPEREGDGTMSKGRGHQVPLAADHERRVLSSTIFAWASGLSKAGWALTASDPPGGMLRYCQSDPHRECAR